MQTSFITKIAIPTFSFGAPCPAAFRSPLHNDLLLRCDLFFGAIEVPPILVARGLYPFMPDAVAFRGARLIPWSAFLAVLL